MIIGYFGNVRQGKTLSAVKELYKFYLKGYKIFSNIHLNFEYTPLTLDYMLDIIENDLDIPPNSVFFVDEIYIWADSRLSGSKRSRYISYFLLQSGKRGGQTDESFDKYADYGLIFLFTAQYPDQCDKRLRHTLDIGVQCSKIILKNDMKVFVQQIFVYKGEKSFIIVKSFKGSEDIYNLYDTRQRIKIETKDRFNQDE